MINHPFAWVCRAHKSSEGVDYSEALASPLIVLVGFTVIQLRLKSIDEACHVFGVVLTLNLSDFSAREQPTRCELLQLPTIPPAHSWQ